MLLRDLDWVVVFVYLFCYFFVNETGYSAILMADESKLLFEQQESREKNNRQ